MISRDLNIIGADNVLITEDIKVRLGAGQYIGGINDDTTIAQGLPIPRSSKETS